MGIEIIPSSRRFKAYMKKVKAINVAMGIEFTIIDEIEAKDAWYNLNAGRDTSKIRDTYLSAYDPE